MKNRKKRRSNRADFVVLVIVSFLASLLLNSAKWVKSAWEGIDFCTIVFQMHTPINGVNSEIVWSYCSSCFPQTVRTVLVIFIIYWLLKCPLEKLNLSFAITFFSKKWQWTLGKTYAIGRMFPKIYFVGILSVYGMLLYFAARDIGVFGYWKSITARSTIFEEEYVDPEKTVLTFPEKKKNLILIYLESMETTYASTEIGGGKNGKLYSQVGRDRRSKH